MKSLFTLYIAILLVFGSAWVINLIKLTQCDFEPLWKEEIIHGVGVIIPPASILTVWF